MTREEALRIIIRAANERLLQLETVLIRGTEGCEVHLGKAIKDLREAIDSMETEL